MTTATERPDPATRRQMCSRKRRHAKRCRAEAVAEHQMRISGDTLRIYSCPFCHGFHITKKDVQ